jgi:monoamine oxidase
MRRTALINAVHRALAIARLCETRRISATEGLALARNLEHAAIGQRRSRREVLRLAAQAGVAGAVASIAAPARRLYAAPQGGSPSVGIVGAGLAGLACADALADAGIVPAVYEAGPRAGGRVFSLSGFFPAQVAERGGEFIDNPHKTMLRYARRFGLEVEDVVKKAGDVTYFFGGRHVSEAVIVDEFREFVHIMRADLRRVSGDVSALSHTPDDVVLDRTSLADYLDGRNGAGTAAGPIVKAAMSEAYVAEYGLEADEQSCLNFLLFIHADRRSKFTPFGVSSDERYHVVDGNDRIVESLAAALPRPVTLGWTLTAVRRTSAGAIELTFDTAGGTETRTHDVVVLAIPFTVLRGIGLHGNLDIPDAQLSAIHTLGYGTNAKLLVGFDGRPWTASDSSGTSYSDLTNHQVTWETNRARASATRAVLTDYASGDRGASLDPAPGALQAQAEAFLADLDLVYPGAAAAVARRPDNSIVAHLEHWPSNPLSLGSYTCYRPGQFTSIAGLEGLSAGQLHFAGEHCNSFHVWQGFMEGAALSGLDVATAIVRAVRK